MVYHRGLSRGKQLQLLVSLPAFRHRIRPSRSWRVPTASATEETRAQTTNSSRNFHSQPSGSTAPFITTKSCLHEYHLSRLQPVPMSFESPPQQSRRFTSSTIRLKDNKPTEDEQQPAVSEESENTAEPNQVPPVVDESVVKEVDSGGGSGSSTTPSSGSSTGSTTESGSSGGGGGGTGSGSGSGSGSGGGSKDDKPAPKTSVKKVSGSRGSGSGKGGAAAAGAGGSDGKEGSSGSGGSGGAGSSGTKKNYNLQKTTVPEVYPQVMALPIARRPLFPGFYKAVTIRDPAVAQAIQEMIKRGQPYVGVFLFKDDNADADTIQSADEVHSVGVFAQVTSTFPVAGEEQSLTAVLYPHRRIRMSRLLRHQQKDQAEATSATTSASEVSSAAAEILPAGTSPVNFLSKTTPTSGIEEDAPGAETTTPSSADEQKGEQQAESQKGDVVASFEEIPETTTPSSSLTSTTSPPTPSPSSSPTSGQVTTSPSSKGAQKSYATAFLEKYPVSLVDVENVPDEPYDKKSPIIRAVTSEIVNVFKEVANLNPLFRDQISTFSMSQMAGNIIDEPARLADFAAAVSAGEVKELQEVLESFNIEERISKALEVLKKELMNAQLQSKISKDVEMKIQKRQREYWLMEQMKGIRRELGIESDGKDKLIEKFKEKSEKLAMPEAVKKVFDEELNKLAHLETAASEFNVTRNYLDWLTQIPWGQRSAENYSIRHAVKVLDEDHHGLKDVKDRILEFIAVGKLRGSVEGKILCFVGPPGVGKTSIGKSIARALQREFYRFSVGGLTDVAEIKGHRRTYVGALPGRIIQALKKCQTENPLILIDEVDKIGRGHQGDPASALLELLDPEQNNSFLDHYMDVPVDLSKVLFVCTANISDTIPRPLLDRMEMIELSGYVADEKMSIAEKYLAPAAKTLSGLDKVDVILQKGAIEELIKSYCRESGVRNLKKQIEKVYRKAALKIVQDIGEDVFSEEKALTEEGKAAQAQTEAAEAAAAEEQQRQQQQQEEEQQQLKEKEKEPEKEQENEDLVESSATSETAQEEGAAVKEDATAAKDSGSDASAAADQASGPATTEKPRVALKVPPEVHVSIDATNLKDYVGPPIFTSDRLYETTPPGVAMGLAWTQMGGSALYVESILESALSANSRPGLERTGNLKDVMKESTAIAYSFAKGFMAKKFPDNKFFENARVHLHCPEGAVPKDGPSAGITMATSLLSLGLDHAISPTVAMTGELTVTGKVLRIGGLREKTVAARRSGANTIIFPSDNMSDWLELPDNIKEGIEGRPVDWFADVFSIVFAGLDEKRAAKLWKDQLKVDKRKKKVSKHREEEDEDGDDSD